MSTSDANVLQDYTCPDMRIRQDFRLGKIFEIKMLLSKELSSLEFTPGNGNDGYYTMHSITKQRI